MFAALPLPHRQGSYLNWLATQPCICTCCNVRPVVLHHLQLWDLPRKRNNPVRDYVTVPVCPYHHDDTADRHAAHRMAQDAWLAHHQHPDPDALLLCFYAAYTRRCGLSLPAGLSARETAEWLKNTERQ